MAALGLEAKLAILDQALNRLEVELENDEHWRALKRPVPYAEAAGQGDAWEARTTRLQMALETNPVYRAWKDVKDAAGSLRGLDAREPGVEGAAADPEPTVPRDDAASSPAPAVAPPDNATALRAQGSEDTAETGPEDFAAHYELPQEIANLIRAELEAAGRQDHMAPPDSEQDMLAVGMRATRAMDKLLSIPSVEPVGPEQIEAARRNTARVPSLRAALEGMPRQSNEQPASSDEPADGHSVPLEADDLAFLLRPSAAASKSPMSKEAAPKETAPKPRVPLLQRLKAEEHVPKPLAAAPAEEAEVTLVRRGAAKAAPPTQPAAAADPLADPLANPLANPQAPTDGAGTKAMRLSQLLKAWTRS